MMAMLQTIAAVLTICVGFSLASSIYRDDEGVLPPYDPDHSDVSSVSLGSSSAENYTFGK